MDICYILYYAVVQKSKAYVLPLDDPATFSYTK